MDHSDDESASFATVSNRNCSGTEDDTSTIVDFLPSLALQGSTVGSIHGDDTTRRLLLQRSTRMRRQ